MRDPKRATGIDQGVAGPEEEEFPKASSELLTGHIAAK